jgi:hypothetical protein
MPEPPLQARVREAATSALWGANGTLAACAVAALVLAAQQGPGGRLADPRVFPPSVVAPDGPAAGVGNPATPEITAAASQDSPGARAGAGGRAVQELAQESGVGVAAAWVALPGAAPAAGPAPAGGALGSDTAAEPVAAQPGTTAPTAPTAQPQAPASGGTTPSGGSAGSPAVPPAGEPAEGPVAGAVEPVTPPVQQVVEAVTQPVPQVVEPVVEVVEPVVGAVEPVTQVVEPVTQVVESVTEALPGPADLGLPGAGSLPVPLG